MVKRSQVLLTLTSLFAAAVVTGCGEVEGGEAGPDNDGPLVLAEQVATASDTEVVGADLGASESTDRKTEARAVAALRSIATANTKTFVSAGVGTTSEGVVSGEFWINFTTEPPDDVVNDLADEGFRTRISWGLPANEHVLSAMQRALVEALDGAPGVAALKAGQVQGPGESGLTVGVATDGDREAILKEALEVANKSDAADEADAVEISVVLEDEEPTQGEFE